MFRVLLPFRRSPYIAAVMSFVLPLLVLVLTGCSDNTPVALAPNEELIRLRQENEEVQRLRRENSELSRLRRDAEERKQLSTVPAELANLREENKSLRAQLGAAAPPPLTQLVEVEPEPEPKLQPIANLPQAFAQAAAELAASEIREEDVPREGDTIQVDQSVIGLLIPEFAEQTNTGPYEVSGWLQSKGVTIQNYQQLNLLGITNYKVLRAPPKKQ